LAEPSQPFDKSQRLRQRAQFQHVFDGGSRIRGRCFTMLVAPGQTPAFRLGIVASRKIGDAVRRNRAKRLIREIFRLTPRPDGATGADIVVIPNRELFDASYKSLEEDFKVALTRGLSRLKKS
jgi:ribonuclease P protein component